MVLSHASAIVGIGVVVGLVASLWLSQFLVGLLFGVEPQDPLTQGGAAVGLALVGACAAAIPAYRASRINPAAVLREL